MRFFLVISVLILIAASAAGDTLNGSASQLWSVGNRRWTPEDEIEFGKWVEENITEDFFIRYKIPTDCADVPYAIRWIYSRIAHLPAAATTRDGKLTGHWSTDWKHLPTHPVWHEDPRFRAALLHVLTETTTRTLPLDTYPIRIDRESVAPGTVFFITESHAGVIGHVFLDGSCAHPLQTWESTLPVKVQKLGTKSFLAPRPESTSHSGLVKFRWPVPENGQWEYLPDKEHPFYSHEQYTSAFYEGYADYVEAVAKRIDPVEYDPWRKMEKVMETITRYIRQRIPIVLDGYQRCHTGGCREGSDLWEIYSTPGRDGMVTLLMDHLSQIIQSKDLDEEVVKNKMEAIRFEISKDHFVTFYHVFQNHLWLSPHPEHSVEARWGLRKCEMIRSRIRDTRTSIAFVEKAYRRSDSKYADFSIRQQQEILVRLFGEWIDSRCKEATPPPKKKKGDRIRNKAKQEE